MDQKITPFQCRYTTTIPDFLSKANASLAISTYQAGKLIFISCLEEGRVIQLPRTFVSPMGIAFDPETESLALACKKEIYQFGPSRALARSYPPSPGKYDQLFLPRITYHTGLLDAHDIAFGESQTIYAVNTLFSCLMVMDAKYSFKTVWKPSFIDALVPEDRCHLNGMAIRDGSPRYVTSLNQGNEKYSWKANPAQNGILMDIASGEILLDGLHMPHSPRYKDGYVYFIESAVGKLNRYHLETGKVETLIEYEGFMRGMDLYGDYALIGYSKIRKNSSSFGKLSIAEKARGAGVLLVYLPTSSILGSINYDNSVDEIYDVKFLPNTRRPNILNTIKDTYQAALSTPTVNYWLKGKKDK